MVISFLDSNNRGWKAHGSPVTKYFDSMEANSLLRNFLPYLDPVTPSGRLTNTKLYRLDRSSSLIG